MTAPRLEARGLAAARAGGTVLCGVELALAPGEVVALTGPSGSGKSTLLRCLVRLDEPAAGRVLLDGRDVRELDACTLRRRVGLVTQVPVMLPGSVRENLAYGLAAPGEDALAGALAAAGLDPAYLGRDARSLSGGEAMRVAIARALAREPAVLLLDEPTAALDPAAAGAVERLTTGLAARGRAVMVVTHDRAQAGRIAARVLAVRDQGVGAAGAPA